MPPPRAATLADVARAAGVSTATVSRHLNAPGTVAKVTAARIAAAVDALGYTPNYSARAMAARRSQMIGAIVPTMENAIFARGLHAFQQEAASLGYTLLVAAHDYDLDAEVALIRTFVARGADGLLLVGQDRAPGVHDVLAQRGVPAVAAWTHAEDALLPTVGFDNRAAMRAMAGAVLALGHRRVALVSAPMRGNDRARHRVEGAQEALAAVDLAPLALLEAAGGLDVAGDALDALLDMPERPTAVICGNDVLAAGVLRRARERGLVVPGDLSVTGFDDIAIAGVVTPPLATVAVPHHAMGRAAAKALVNRIAGGAAGPVRLATELCLRGSLSAPGP